MQSVELNERVKFHHQYFRMNVEIFEALLVYTVVIHLRLTTKLFIPLDNFQIFIFFINERWTDKILALV